MINSIDIHCERVYFSSKKSYSVALLVIVCFFGEAAPASSGSLLVIQTPESQSGHAER